MAARILVAGVGNIFLSDDGFGPEVVRRLAVARPERAEVRIVDYGIRGMHLAYDLLSAYDALVLVDAVPGDVRPPGVVSAVEVDIRHLPRGEFDGHGMDPVAVLTSVESLGGAVPPTYLVCCTPESVEDGIGLTDPVSAVVDDAVALTSRLLDDLLGEEGGGSPCASAYQAR